MGINENADEVTDEFDKLLKDLQLQRDLDIISDEEYYAELEKLRDTYLTKGSEKWWQYTKEIISYEEDMLAQTRDSIQDTFSELVQNCEKDLEEIEKMVDSMSNKLKSFSQLYTEETVTAADGTEITVAKLGDPRQTAAILDRYDTALTTVKNRMAQVEGIDPDFINEFMDQITSMGVEEGMRYAEALAKSSDYEFEYQITGWQANFQKSEEIADKFYQDRRDDLGEEFVGDINEAIAELPDDFLENGKLCMDMFEEGFLQELSNFAGTLYQAVSSQLGLAGIFAGLGIPVQVGSAASGAASGGTSTSVTYNFNGSRMSIAEQRMAAQQQADLDRLRWA